jgi:hypothetical protein
MKTQSLGEAWRQAFTPFPQRKCPAHPEVILDLDHERSTWTSGQWSAVEYKPCSSCVSEIPTAIA